MENNMKSLYIFLLTAFVINQAVAAQNITDSEVIRDTSYTTYGSYIKEVKKRPFIKIAEARNTQSLEVYTDIIYSRPNTGRNLKLNLYRPKDNKKYPALILVHGGGWNSGNKSMQIPLAQSVAAHGYVTLPVEYRLSPEAGYPAGVYDLKNAVKWVKMNAGKYNIDTTFIAMSGCSAGGQLACLIGTTNGQSKYENTEYSQYSSHINAVINIDGVSDFTEENSLKGIDESLAKNKIPASVKWFGGSIREKGKEWIEASSVFNVTKESAPVCFINSSIPRFHDGRDKIIEKFENYNIYSEIHTIGNTPHTFWLFNPWFDQTVKYMTYFLDRMSSKK